MSNYPPGVTGNEDIFGPKREYEGRHSCESCENICDGMFQEWNYSLTWTCVECTMEITVSDEYGTFDIDDFVTDRSTETR